MNPKVGINCVVRNEEKWVWYALQSVMEYVEDCLVWDTGSTDHTPQVIREIIHPHLQFQQGEITTDETELSQVRQKMLERTDADWLWILDGDEVWPEASIQIVMDFIKEQGDHYDSIVVPTLNCVGDTRHISPPQSGKYTIAGKTGHFNVRFINLNRVEGLHVANPPGQLQSYLDKDGVRIQDRDAHRIAFLDAPYLHMTHLSRSAKRKDEVNVFWRQPKKKYELGIPLPRNFLYPKCFYFARPDWVVNPWRKRSVAYLIQALLLFPLRVIKRKIYA